MNEKSDHHKYTILDQPEVLNRLFHPGRREAFRAERPGREDLLIPVDEGIKIGASFHFADKKGPILLYFHGNGEIVSDYDDFGRFYTELGINFLVADYRGYGDSQGSPTVSTMMADCHKILDFALSYCRGQGFTGPMCLMGRSLGSASAIELASKRETDIFSLIIESGFAYAGPLLRILGIDPDRIGFTEAEGFDNIDKIELVEIPCLIIHAEYDHIIPITDGTALHEACGAQKKFFLEIKNADHNDLFFKGMTSYLEQVRQICFLNGNH